MGSHPFKVSAISAAILSLLSLLDSAEAKRRHDFEGPVTARVLDVLDGDTFLADAEIWPGQTLRVNIRIRGIDAPEMKSRCQAERDAALRAREALIGLVSGGAVSLSNIGGAKYFGRVLADVSTESGEAVNDVLLASGLVRFYDGGKRAGWCG